MSQISIPGYPANNLVPGDYFAIDATKANTDQQALRTLLIGPQNTSAIVGSTAPSTLGRLIPGVAVLAGSVTDVQSLAGNGSPLALMYEAYRKVDDFTEVWLLPLNDDSASTYQSYLLTFNGTATEAGTLSFYGAGQLVQVPIQSGQAPADFFPAFLAAVNNNPNLPFVITGGSVDQTGTFVATVSAKVKGIVGDVIDLNYNYLGSAGGERFPAGLGFGVSGAAAGTGVPTALAGYLANLGDKPFDFICSAYADETSLNTIQSWLNDQTGRWSLFNQIFGHAFYAIAGTVGQRATFFAARNDQHASAIGYYNSPSTPWEWAAGLTAAASISVQEDPAVPVTGYVLPVRAPREGSADSFDERQTLLTDGCSTFTVNNANQVVLERVVTTYTSNPVNGVPDDSYRDYETMTTLTACIRDMKAFLLGQFARKKLVADGSLISGGSNMTTAQLIKQAAISRYRTQANVYGWCQNPDQFAKQIQSQNAGGGVVRLLLPYQLANQLRVIACNVQFTKP